MDYERFSIDARIEQAQRDVRYRGLEEFTYGNDGPWPQPSPDRPMLEPRRVLHLPREEGRQHGRHVVGAYLKTMVFELLPAAWSVLRRPTLDVVDDDTFVDMMTASQIGRAHV